MKNLFGIIMFCAVGATISAGPLTPPGAPAPTMKTLDEVEARTPIHLDDIPLIISSPGSYYLAENISVPADAGLTTAAIVIQSSYVTIDLNGFTLAGSNASGVSGVLATGHLENVVVRNGYVTRWEEYGLRLDIDAAIVENVRVAQNHGSGIALSAGRVINCIVRNNGLEGISFWSSQVNGISAGSCLIDRCEVFNNGESGIVSQRRVTISNTVSTRNQGNGISLQGSGSTIESCTASNNSKCGVILSSSAEACRIIGNHCNQNGETGIVISARGCRVEDNHVANNQITGLAISQRSMAFRNTAYDNADLNFDFITEAITGPIITTTISGVVSSDHPWANFSYHTSKIGN